MIIILKDKADQNRVNGLIRNLESQGLHINYSEGQHSTIIGLIGDTSVVDLESLKANDFVYDVKRVSEPFKAANRKFHGDDTIVNVHGVEFGGGHFSIIAGPCSVETEEQIVSCAKQVKAAGAQLLRGGAFKPRTSPYAFQGLRAHGLELLKIAKAETGMPIVSELTGLHFLDLFDHVDVIQVGARNMQNFEMLKELGKVKKPILLKRGLSSTLEEFLMSAEYILASGNPNVILCERGIRTFETATRNTLDVSAIPLVKELSHLPIIADPSHASGIYTLVAPLAKAAVCAGADGLMIEVHPSPETALCDGAQSLSPKKFAALMNSVRQLAELEGKVL